MYSESMARVLRTLKVGRGADCDITLGDSTVSRRHASLELNPDNMVVQEAMSFEGIEEAYKMDGPPTIRYEAFVRHNCLCRVVRFYSTIIFNRTKTRTRLQWNGLGGDAVHCVARSQFCGMLSDRVNKGISID